jgi:hypothetical protein
MLVKQNIAKATLVFIAIVITSFANAQSKQSSLNIESLYTILGAKDSLLFNAAFTTCNTSQV